MNRLESQLLGILQKYLNKGLEVNRNGTLKDVVADEIDQKLLLIGMKVDRNHDVLSTKVLHCLEREENEPSTKAS